MKTPFTRLAAGERGYRWLCWIDSWMVPLLAVVFVAVAMLVWAYGA